MNKLRHFFDSSYELRDALINFCDTIQDFKQEEPVISYLAKELKDKIVDLSDDLQWRITNEDN